ncbi:nitrogenase iron-molybdenum cofactor biosynthesis protein NifN [Psychromonas antarctica]|jgi:nitrogenase molybdenum-iron protein NifN|uniref:nitrogenase iron-molybdenum cofactor biosynthesis protein NifN n=1 Tax=Psychromonas antarctica TaxID=67573 RepID=UPI001EE80024|nr:nitrogenase iron-molybdenum cofactor biosynthesis protein NifN [Psychromonas antarctica]MCG6200814.1 nitrogenase iron-molybdenum cofactor biosynthesis protein NifN [Psychromonas antarctica]
MAQIIPNKKALAEQPLKVGQPLGAALAFLAIDRAMPLMHAAQGCSAFAKVFLIQHFHEPIPMQSTAMDPISTVMGSDDNLMQAFTHLCSTQHPKLIGLLTSGLTEAQGCDIESSVRLFKEENPKYKNTAIIPVNTPDFYGSLETGYAGAVEAMIKHLVVSKTPSSARRKRVNILVSHMLTPGDIELLKSYVEAFGLTPVVIPDLSLSLDGYLAVQDFNSLSQGGCTVEQIKTVGQALATIVIGHSLDRAASILVERTQIPTETFAHLHTLEQTDRLIMLLSRLSGRKVPVNIERARGQLCDALIDTHTQLGGKKAGLAMEADHLNAFSALLKSANITLSVIIAPCNQPQLVSLPIDKVQIGDLSDLHVQAANAKVDILLSNAHAQSIAKEMNIPLLRIGIPIHDEFGCFAKSFIGYSGIRNTLFELANLLRHEVHSIPVYHSPLKQDLSQIKVGVDYV